MANGAQKTFLDMNSEIAINIENAASLLGISSATIRNWTKRGYLKTLDNGAKNLFCLDEIKNLKSKIKNGDFLKLNQRANKLKANRTFVPKEYLEDENGLDDLSNIIGFIQENNIDLTSSLLSITLNLLVKENLLSPIVIKDIEQKQNFQSSNKQITKEINSWLTNVGKIKKEYSYLLDCPLPKHRDILGYIYQSLMLEGKKSQSGSYYTPPNIVNGIVREYTKNDSKVFDPCCGTGQFLLAFSDIVENPLNIYGVDFDEIAVKIARLNILIKFKNKDFVPNIVCKNTLFDIGSYDLFGSDDENIKDFDVIATNPPWGAHFSKGDIEKLKRFYPAITSIESFSYFLKKSIGLLRDNGVISFILPESILNVKTHKDIREIILKNSQIKKIVYLNRIFKNVFTPVIRVDLAKSDKKNNKIKIRKEDKKYDIEQARWLNNHDFIFDIHANGFDAEIIDKIYRTNHTTLKSKAEWALGIVTGNNDKFIVSEQKKGFEPIYKGKDVERFVLGNPSNYIYFAPDKFQQIAPTEKYRAKEKLIYRFISKNLVFAYDNQQKLTLNSANALIPKISNYPIKVIAALLNSSLYQFIFQKKFSSIKVLRSHIEQMPLPLWDKKTFSKITKLVDETIKDKSNFEKLDNYIMDKFTLSLKEKIHINKFN